MATITEIENETYIVRVYCGKDRCGKQIFKSKTFRSSKRNLPYHKLTGSKYAMTGRKYEPEFDETIPPQLHLDLFKNYGIEVTVL